MNENKRLKVWIVVLSCLLVLFGGYVFYLEYYKGLDNTNKEVEKETEIKHDSINKIEIDNEVALLSANEVEDLVLNYTELGNSFSDFTLKVYYGLNEEGKKVNYDFENTKLSIAIKNITGVKIDDCSKFANEDFILDGEWYMLKNEGYFCINSQSYDYNSVNQQYKYLFGEANNVKKNSVEMIKYYYYYIDDQYITLLTHDDGLWPDGQISKITDFEQDGKDLEVTVSYLYNSEYDAMPAPEINDKIINEMFNARNDYSYQFKMIFEYENDHFVLKNINKII